MNSGPLFCLIWQGIPCLATIPSKTLITPLYRWTDLLDWRGLSLVLIDDVLELEYFFITSRIEPKVYRPGDICSNKMMGSHPYFVTCSFVLTFAVRELATCLSSAAIDSFEVYPGPIWRIALGLAVALTGVSKSKERSFGDFGIDGSLSSHMGRSLGRSWPAGHLTGSFLWHHEL